MKITPYVSNDIILNEVDVADEENRLVARNKIETLILAMEEEFGIDNGVVETINEAGLKEYFVDGAYIRELLIPKDTAMVSQIWKKERMWIIASGEVTFTTEMGTRRVKAPYTEVVPTGSRVALYTHEDTLWFAITGSTNTENVREDIIAEDYNDCIYPWDILENK